MVGSGRAGRRHDRPDARRRSSSTGPAVFGSVPELEGRGDACVPSASTATWEVRAPRSTVRFFRSQSSETLNEKLLREAGSTASRARSAPPARGSPPAAVDRGPCAATRDDSLLVAAQHPRSRLESAASMAIADAGDHRGRRRGRATRPLGARRTRSSGTAPPVPCSRDAPERRPRGASSSTRSTCGNRV